MTAGTVVESRHSVLLTAAFLLAEHGIPASLQALAASDPRLAASDLMDRFGDVDNLVSAIFAELLTPGTAAMRQRLDTPSTTVSDALAPFAQGHGDRGMLVTPFLQATLEGHGVRGGAASPPLLEPLLRALRRESELPSPDELPLRTGEAEIVVAMLADLAVLAGPSQALSLPAGSQRTSALSFRMLLAGATTALRSLHARPATNPTIATRE
jgi:hypothetical protein